MKNGLPLKSILFLCCVLVACSKSSQGPAVQVAPQSAITFSANDSLIHYSIDLVYIQDVDSTHTTLISGEYPDSSSKKGSLAIRLPGDTTGRFNGGNLLVTYTDGQGNVYYNTQDSTNYVEVDKYPKSYNGVIVGSFSFKVAGGAGSVTFSNGSIIAIFQK
ncbi:hypothetical protein [Puia dinghuensis]|uniref:DUF4251 domain-containing protein n=1 Tax=Puia dinghuensis TaxID=1792502 RepID=A0A8J2U800_9BACT|nr:hypothetical protein [Puia dinghuensis]GGA85564.1 hypothetical protein GCM10011511_05720 [Puia dinghuensis]